ncbi:polyprenyl synthetase family protein [bacterium]|nr:polyprenyl synthetase family protein [bacterium]
MTFSENYNSIKNLVNKELQKIEQKMISEVQIREPLNSYLTNFLTSPSKRIRSVLTILYLKALGEELTDNQLELLSIIELVHNASLIHDDIIDESTLRRGELTISAKFGNKLGVISGDYILSLAMQKLAKINNIEVISHFSKTIKQMCIGEINQNFDKFKIGTIENYIDKTKNKTGYLFETALICCTMFSEKELGTEQAGELGINTGIAFQIRDDLINYTNTDKSKPFNNDIKEGIYNAPIIYSGNINDYSSGIEKTKVLLDNHIQNSLKITEKLPVNEYSIALKKFLELLNNV